MDPMPDPAPPSARRIDLPSGTLEYTLRRSARSRGLRVTIDPRLGVVVTVPLAGRRGWARPEAAVERFLRERESWVVRHLARQVRQRGEVAAHGGVRDGAQILYRGSFHLLRVVQPTPGGATRSSVERSGTAAGDELTILFGTRDRRALARVLEEWLRDRAAEAIDRAVAIHAPALAVAPTVVVLRDPSSRWGSASRTGRLMFSWRLVLAPPEVLEGVVVHELAHLRVFGHGPRFWAIVAGRLPDHEERRRWLRRHAHELHGLLESHRKLVGRRGIEPLQP